MTLKEFLITQNNLEDENLPLCYVTYDAENDEEILMDVTGFSIQKWTSPFNSNDKRKVLFVYGEPTFIEPDDDIEELIDDNIDFDMEEQEEEPVDDGRMLLDRAQRIMMSEHPYRIDGTRPLSTATITINNTEEQKETIKNLHDAMVNWNKPKDDIVSVLSKPLTPKESVDLLTYEWNIFKDEQKGKEGGHVTKF